MDTRWIMTGGLIATAAAAFFLGRSTAPAPEGQDAVAVEAAKLSRDRGAPPDRTGADRSREANPRLAAGGGEGRSEALQQEIADLLGSPDAIDRSQAWLAFVNGLDIDEFESVVAAFREAGFNRTNLSEYGMVLSAWAKLDPYGALDYAKENTGGPYARNTILATWASTDPEGAIAWADSNHEGDDANPWMVGVIRGLAPYDRARASELLAQMPYSEQRGEALAAVLPLLLREGAGPTKAWIDGLDDTRLQGGALRRAADELAREDPRGTAEWIVNEHPEHGDRVIDDVLGGWVRESEADAVAYFQGLPEGNLRTNALRGITNGLAMEDPQAAADFLDRHATDANDRTYTQFVWHSFGQDPELAVSYIDRIQRSGEQSATYRRMLDAWLRRDFDAASRWIDTNPLPEEVAQRINQRRERMQGGDR